MNSPRDEGPGTTGGAAGAVAGEVDAKALITALDFADPADIRAFATRLDPTLTRVKIGNEAFTVAGPALVDELQHAGFEVFLDLKFHDIPNTVAAAVRRAAALGVWMVNVHASGGRRMLEAARESLAVHGGAGGGGTRLIGVTVLTSLAREDLVEVGLDVEPEAQVERLAALACATGLDGVVCSPHEIALVRSLAPASFMTVTPGIRAADAAAGDDQRRTMTPGEAIRAGADHLVVGRPVTRAPDPLAALRALVEDIDAARRPSASEAAGAHGEPPG